MLYLHQQGETLSFFDEPPQGNHAPGSGGGGGGGGAGGSGGGGHQTTGPGGMLNLEFVEFSSFQVGGVSFLTWKACFVAINWAGGGGGWVGIDNTGAIINVLFSGNWQLLWLLKSVVFSLFSAAHLLVGGGGRGGLPSVNAYGDVGVNGRRAAA